MPGFDTSGSTGNTKAPVPESQAALCQRLGQVLFLLYLSIYAGFVLLNAFAPGRMEETPWAGVNLAVLYGLGLILAAFALALLYDGLCRFLVRKAGNGGREERP